MEEKLHEKLHVIFLFQCWSHHCFGCLALTHCIQLACPTEVHCIPLRRLLREAGVNRGWTESRRHLHLHLGRTFVKVPVNSSCQVLLHLAGYLENTHTRVVTWEALLYALRRTVWTSTFLIMMPGKSEPNVPGRGPRDFLPARP